MGLFPSPSLDPGRGGVPYHQLETLLEFRAGKMILEGTRVHADPRKGVIRIVKLDDGLVHFQWWDLVANVMEEDQIVFPEETTFEKVSQSSGRVYVLKFSDNRRFLFWMQGHSLEEDEKLCDNVRRHLNQSLYEDDMLDETAHWPISASGVQAALHGSERESVLHMSGDMEHDAELSKMSDVRELWEMSTLREIVGDDPPPSSVGAVQLFDLQRILQGLGQVPVPFPQDFCSSRSIGCETCCSGNGELSEAGITKSCSLAESEILGSKVLSIVSAAGRAQYEAAAQAHYQDTGPSFVDILKPNMVLPLLGPRSLDERLVSYLPEGVETPEALADLMQSPQFQQQLNLFTHVLRSGQLDWRQFGIDPSNYDLTVTSFLEAIEDQVKSITEPHLRDDERPDSKHERDDAEGDGNDDHKSRNDNDQIEEGL